MRILFLHPNFPAQFKHLISYLSTDNDVKFICQTHYGRTIKGVNLITIKYKGGHEAFMATTKTELNRINARSIHYRSAFQNLKNSGWNPDVVISHCGWGCGIHVKEVWPDAKMICYVEWWFDPGSDLIKLFDNHEYLNYSDESKRQMWKRNIAMTFEMTLSDFIIAPTEWQKDQLPKRLKKQCRVIYDGIDENTFKYDKSKRSKTPRITYGTRGMEPMRCFPEFINSLPILLNKWPELRIEIAGLDEVCYGGKLPKEGTWGKWAINKLETLGLDNRVNWLGRLEKDDYVSWLQGSWCHIYLTQPFVVSWSLQEALFCGIPLVTNECKAIYEFKNSSTRIQYAQDLTPKSIADAVNIQLRNFNQTEENYNSSKDFELRKSLTLKPALRAWRYVANQLVSS